MTAVWNPIMEMDDSQAQKLNIAQLSGLFYMYVIGMTAAITVFVLEVWCSKKQSAIIAIR